MPKIIVRENDKTSAGSRNYNNFDVVIPGFIADNKSDTIFDENGIYYCENIDDFENYIGCVPAKKEKKQDPIAPVFANGPANYTKEEFESYFPSGCVYYVNENTSGKIGYLKTAEYEMKKATKYIAHELYCVIQPGDEGQDAKEAQPAHFGNQIAYELLRLGYKVLYKKLDNIADLTSEKFWKPLKDKSLYDFRYVVNGLLNDNLEANKCIRDLAACRVTPAEDFNKIDPLAIGRGDCFALCDVDEKDFAQGMSQYEAVDIIQDYAENFADEDGKYAVLITPSITYKAGLASAKYNNSKLPGSFHYLACADKAFANYREWYAVAGYTRGISNLVVDKATVNFGEYAINALQPRVREEAISAVNVITNIRNNYYIWGNRTAFYDQARSTDGLIASDFLNIRQLCCTIKKQIYTSCKQFTFDPNSDILWVNFTNSLTPMLDLMKADQGIREYKIVKIATDQKGLLKARIRIIPIEAVEDFDIMLSLEDSISGTVVSFND